MAGSPKATLGRINIAECTKSTHVEVSVAMTPTCAANCKTVVVKPSTKAADAKEDGIESKALLLPLVIAKVTLHLLKA